MSKNEHSITKILFYTTPQGPVAVELLFENETFWMTQKRIAELFGVEVPAVSKPGKHF